MYVNVNHINALDCSNDDNALVCSSHHEVLRLFLVAPVLLTRETADHLIAMFSATGRPSSNWSPLPMTGRDPGVPWSAAQRGLIVGAMRMSFTEDDAPAQTASGR